MNIIIEDETYNNLNFQKNSLKKGDFENCTFLDCNFLNSDISNVNFFECDFINCDLSSAIIVNTTFKEVNFTDCKMVGLQFEKCNEVLFSANFKKSILSYSSFYNRVLKNVTFNHCNLTEVDFTLADISKLILANCDCKDAIFDQTIMEQSDFRTSFNFIIHPEKNRINKAKFTKENVSGLLVNYNIHIE